MFVCERERRGRRAPPRPLSHLPPIARSILPRTSSLKVAAKPWALSPSLACCSAPGKGGGRRWVRKGVNAARAGLVVGWCPPPVFFFFLLPGKAGAHAPAPAPPPPPPSKHTLLGHLLHHGVGLDGKALEGAAGGREEGEGQACVCEEEERLDGRAAGGAPPPPLGRAAVVALLRRHTHAHAHVVRGHAHALCAEPRRQIKNRAHALRGLASGILFRPRPERARPARSPPLLLSSSSSSPVGQAVDENLVQQVVHDPGEEGHGGGARGLWRAGAVAVARGDSARRGKFKESFGLCLSLRRPPSLHRSSLSTSLPFLFPHR